METIKGPSREWNELDERQLNSLWISNITKSNKIRMIKAMTESIKGINKKVITLEMDYWRQCRRLKWTHLGLKGFDKK